MTNDNDNKGKKYDQDKTRYDLVPPDTLKEVADVLTFGATKYSDDNWKLVPDAHKRYYSAAMRHLQAWRVGEAFDDETKKPHLAHAICCLIFLNELDIEVHSDETQVQSKEDSSITKGFYYAKTEPMWKISSS